MKTTTGPACMTLPSIQALLDRLDPPVDGICPVSGCVHRTAGDHHEATWVGDALIAA